MCFLCGHFSYEVWVPKSDLRKFEMGLWFVNPVTLSLPCIRSSLPVSVHLDLDEIMPNLEIFFKFFKVSEALWPFMT